MVLVLIAHLFHRREQQELEEQEAEVAQPRGPRRRKPAFTLPERSDNGVQLGNRTNPKNNYEQEKSRVSGGLWTDDDILELIKLVKKYPGGTTDRWEKIADAMNRTVHEVTHMAKKVCHLYFVLPYFVGYYPFI